MGESPEVIAARLPERRADSHKGDFGHALLIGGSRGMAGSISLSGMACLRSGAGLVTLAVPASSVDVVASFEPAYMTLPLADDLRGRLTFAGLPRLLTFAGKVTCAAIGPGLGRSTAVDHLVHALYQRLEQPLVVDADGLNALARKPQLLGSHTGPRVLTPHPGEFRRLLGSETRDSREALEAAAIEFAQRFNVVLLLKGQHSLITDGTTSVHNSTGNPGMATGGSGDVLTGVITALIGQGLSPLQAAICGARIHGRAGDLAAQELGMVSLTASDLVRHLSAAFQAE